MGDKVIAITKTHLPIGGTPIVVVDLLEQLIQKAERGELRGMAVAWVEGNGDVVHQIAEGCAGNSSLVAAVTALFWYINKQWASDD